MSVINVLDPQTANLIAAGEVVDRPAAVAKELLENAIDAGSTAVTIEIKNGGSSLIRVTDNGRGMAPDDVKNSVLRHATSKIRTPKDLEGIMTLGFRGEALAAISSISRFQIISKEPHADFGACMSMEGEKLLSFEEAGCPDGTTVTVRDIFFNVPARRKFLKKDATETAYISQYVERIALSHPDIAIKFIADSRVRFSTSGTGELYDTIYSVFGREFLDGLTKIEHNGEKISIRGFISLPDKAKINRNHQILFVNNRLVRSRIISYAVEDAYKSYIMTERYPAFILFVDINPYLVDINVHPAKLEVRFADDALVRESVYFAVKNHLEKTLNPIKEDFLKKSEDEFERQMIKNAFVPLGEKKEAEQQEIFVPKITREAPPAFTPQFSFAEAVPIEEKESPSTLTFRSNDVAQEIRNSALSFVGKAEENPPVEESVPEKNETLAEDKCEEVPATKFAKYRGVVFDTYVIAEYDDAIYLIDKHAAHERIIYEGLKSRLRTTGTQGIIDTRVISLTPVEFAVAMDNLSLLSECGFDLEQFGDTSLALRGVPSEFASLDVSYCEKLLSEMITDLLSGKSAKLTKEEVFDKTLYTAACKAATKAGYPDSEESYTYLINKLFEMENVFCCPHGRPIMVKYTKYQIERMFFRT